MSPSLDDLLARRVAREGEVAVSAGDVMRWSEAHRETALRHWPDRTQAWIAPPAMVTSFIRPLEWRPDRVGPPTHRGSSLHELLKAELGYPLGIAAGYELELHGLLHDGDSVDGVERIASLGEEETTRLGLGRRWVIENTCTRRSTGELVAVERFSMLGYDPAAATTDLVGSPGRTGSDQVSQPLGVDRVEELDVTAVGIVMGAAANRVWVAAHLDRDAAQAAGVRDTFMDTSTQLGLLSGVAVRAVGPDARPGRLVLRMRRPICPGDHLRMEARVTAVDADPSGTRWATVAVRAVVDGVVHSSLEASIAASAPDGRPTDPWLLSGSAWSPVGDAGQRNGSRRDG